ncbi:hypothetical protein D3C73_943540 [compost metagenome]
MVRSKLTLNSASSFSCVAVKRWREQLPRLPKSQRTEICECWFAADWMVSASVELLPASSRRISTGTSIATSPAASGVAEVILSACASVAVAISALA